MNNRKLQLAFFGVLLSMSVNAYGVSLASITASNFNTRSNSLLMQSLGAGVSFSTFSNDPEFVARTPSSTATASVADVFLDTLGSSSERRASGNLIVGGVVQQTRTESQLYSNIGQNLIDYNLLGAGSDFPLLNFLNEINPVSPN
jgi:hypothetical protein